MRLKANHSKGIHPVLKRHFDFTNDRYSWYWIYMKAGYIFNTYDWYIDKVTKNYVIWRNIYCYGEEDEPIIKVQFKSIRKVICWKTNPYNNLNWDLLDKEENK